MTPMQQILLGVGAKKKTYMEDVYSTYLWTGNGSDQTINTGLNMSGEGGMVWVKNRSVSKSSAIVDTVRGAGKWIESDSTDDEDTYAIDGANPRNINSFTSTGFTLKSDDGNQQFNWATSDPKYSSWNFRKAPGFFTMCTWSGNDTAGRTISHDLGSVPGLIMVKRRTTNDDWRVYHRGSNATAPEDYVLRLSQNYAAGDTATWNDAKPTATEFTLNSYNDINGSGDDYIAYVFAGGASTATTAYAADFDGTNDYMYISDHDDFNLGSGDFTVEGWVKLNAQNATGTGFLAQWNSASDRSWFFGTTNGNYFGFFYTTDGANIVTIISNYIVPDDGQFHHYAAARDGNTLRLFVDGRQVKSSSFSATIYNGTGNIAIGHNVDAGAGWYLNGSISNLRLVKGTAVYTSSFRPPTEPLTNITNTKLLCCNNSNPNGYTVSPGSISEDGSPGPSANIYGPFDDPAAFTFGEEGNEGIIKCGSYLGNGANDGPTIELGWEPQWIMIKSTADGIFWVVFDSMRGIIDGDSDKFIYPNDNNAELSNNYIKLTPTGFQIQNAHDHVNTDNTRYTFTAIRRPDGYVGKPAEVGTDVFTMDTGNSSSTIPVFDSAFPVDFALTRPPASANDWWLYARKIQQKYLKANANFSEGASNGAMFDSNVGYSTQNTFDSSFQSWMWKRHAGFDLITYKGSSTDNRKLSHGLGKIPEMWWVRPKYGTNSHLQDWRVYHKGLNGGTNPEQYYLAINNNGQESSSTQFWYDTAPTSTHITLGSSAEANNSTLDYIIMLFASVPGISKLGYYTGNGNAVGNNPLEITVGFQPRFVIIKRRDGANAWTVLDTTRGWGSGNDQYITLNDTAAQSAHDLGAPTSTGFTVDNDYAVGGSGANYIYYAHA